MTRRFTNRFTMPSARISAALAVVWAVSLATTLQAETRVQTFTYKRVGDLQIQADVYTQGERQQRPVLVWIHGGALIMGHRELIDSRLKDELLGRGYAFVSIDYRLAPETQLPQIIEDVTDALRWVHDEGPELFQADPRAIAVAGSSAGGYLTLVTGYRAKHRPVALVSFWGYGEIVGPWYSEPSPHPRHHQSKLTREQAFAQVSGPPISDARQRRGDGSGFYQFCRQQGSWPIAVTGWNPKTEPDKFVPYMPLKNVTADYPPTVFIHGTLDTDVPYEESVLMSRELARNRVEQRLISINEAEHGLPGVNPEIINNNYAHTLEFLERQIKKAQGR